MALSIQEVPQILKSEFRNIKMDWVLTIRENIFLWNLFIMKNSSVLMMPLQGKNKFKVGAVKRKKR